MQTQTASTIMFVRSLQLTGSQYDYWIKRYNTERKRHNLATAEALRDYIESLRNRYAPASLQIIKSALWSGFTETYKHIRDPIFWQAAEYTFRRIRIKRTKTKISDDKYLTEPEIRKLLDNVDRRTAAIIWLYAKTGCRLSELVNLRLDDCRPRTRIDRETGQRQEIMSLTVRGKGGKVRMVEISKSDFRRIKSIMQSREYLLTDKFGTQYSMSHIYTIIRNAGRSVLNMRVTPHTLRHSFATNLLKRGATIAELASYLGHSSARVIAEYYVHGTLRPEILDAYLLPPQASLIKNRRSKHGKDMEKREKRRSRA
jgi:integrase